MRGTRKSITLGLAAVLLAASARADEPRWRVTETPFAPAAQAPSLPAVRIGRPVPLSDAEASPPPARVTAPLQAVAYSPPALTPGPRFVRAQAPDGNFQRNDAGLPPIPVPAVAAPPVPPATIPPPPPPPGPGEAFFCATATSNAPPAIIEQATQGAVGLFTPLQGHGIFQSDNRFPWMISPVSEPFFAEDPRALTELRPIFIYQQTPHSNPGFHNGDVGFFGLQGRVSVAQSLSLVISKAGGIWTDPHNPDTTDFRHQVGLSELWLGPQLTIIRNPESRTLLAAGLTFQLPVGSSRAFQNTGNLTLAPYISFAQNFLHFDGFGSFNFMNTTGYAFGTDNRRTDYLYTQFHLDYDFCDGHKFFPLLELNWTHYTQNGRSQDINFEGKDLFNFGAMHVAGTGELSLALGARYKFCEGIQLGGAVALPLYHRHSNFDDFRVTIDMIFRY